MPDYAASVGIRTWTGAVRQVYRPIGLRAKAQMAGSGAAWLSATAAALVAIALTATSMLLSRRSAARIDRLVAVREAADRQRKQAADDADQPLKDNLSRTRR